MKILLPPNVAHIISVLEKHGYESYAVGGCVRDFLLGKEPDDWDITTSAKPEEIKSLFKHTVDTGIVHGTVTVLMAGEGYEVTTYRIDGEYEDSRHPKEIAFTSDLTEDLRRRDFTINAMAYNEHEGLVDVFEGMKDLKNGIIRCVGDAGERFTEDALRILRAIRFSAQLGFRIEDKTREAIREHSPSLSYISVERIGTELVKLMVSKHPEYWKTAYETGITAVIMPEFDTAMMTEQNNPHHKYSVGEHTLAALSQVEAEKSLRLAVLFHDLGKSEARFTDEEGGDHFHGHARISEKIAENILRRLKFDNDTITKVTKLVKYHDIHPVLQAKSIRKLIHKAGEDIFPMLLKVQKADILAQSEFEREKKCSDLKEMERIYKEILEKQECLSLKQLAVTGHDLIRDGMRPGRELGAMLERLLEHVLEHPEHNNRDYLIAYSKNFRELHK